MRKNEPADLGQPQRAYCAHLDERQSDLVIGRLRRIIVVAAAAAAMPTTQSCPPPGSEGDALTVIRKRCLPQDAGHGCLGGDVSGGDRDQEELVRDAARRPKLPERSPRRGGRADDPVGHDVP